MGGRWSATSCQTRRGMDTISTLPGGSASAVATALRCGRRGAAAHDSAAAAAAAAADSGTRSSPAEEVPVQLLGGLHQRVRPPHLVHGLPPGLGHRCAAAGSASSSATAAASARASPTGTIRPLDPLPDHLRHQPTGVATTGRRSTSASASTSGPDSQTEGMATTSAAASSSGALSLGPDEEPRWRRGRGRGSASVSSPASGPSPTTATRTSTPPVREQRGRPRPASAGPSAGGGGRRRPRATDRRRRRGGPGPLRGRARASGAGPRGRITRTGPGGVLLHVAADLRRHRDQRVGALEDAAAPAPA